jgi:NitT/TauT family transport system ATP-binding protein
MVNAVNPFTPLDDDRSSRVVEPTAGEGAGSPAVSLAAVSKVFGTASNATPALDRVSLDVRPGEFVCVLGASGCGKSTMLNLVAGLDRPTSGTLTVASDRPALMFQEAALFPWLTVQGNVELALKLAHVPKAERRPRVHELLRLVNLDEFAARRPHELSGGMRQRVALARALAQRSELLLMDEPFGALDAMTRDLLHDELEALWSSTGLTVLFVTHNVREAVRLGDRVILLSSRPGRIAHEYEIGIPRPRRIDSPEVSSLAAEITDRLRAEVRRHADVRTDREGS